MKIIITDLTRFKNKDIVCVAGINPATGQCVRPMLDNGTRLEYLPFNAIKSSSIIPGSCLEGNFIPVADACRPHVEDHRSSGSIKVVASASGADFKAVLEKTAHTSIQSAFGTRPNNRCYADIATPSTSIATLRLDDPPNQFQLVIDNNYGPSKFKAHVTDAEGFNISWLPVTDLGFSDHIQKVQKEDPALLRLNKFLKSQKTLYLRVGLSRLYASQDRTGYWVQLNGIYSFPNFRKDLRIYD